MTCRWMPLALYVTSATFFADTFSRTFLAFRSTMLEAFAAGATASSASSAMVSLRGISRTIGGRGRSASPIRATRTLAAAAAADRGSAGQAHPVWDRSVTLPAVSGARAPIVIAALVMVVWGASPAMTKIAGEDFTALQVGVLRTVLAGLVAAPIVLLTRQALPVGRRRRALLAISAVSGFVAFPLLFTLGQQRTSAMHGNMILAALPICTGAYAALLDRRRPGRRWVLGSAIALAGEAGLVAIRTHGGAGTAPTLAGDALIVASALVVAVGYVAGGPARPVPVPPPAR